MRYTEHHPDDWFREARGVPPSYRDLAWHLSQDGSDIRPDLLGDDQPDGVARQYQAEYARLNHDPGHPGRPRHTKEQ